MSDPPAGVREMRRVTRPGGTVATAVWDYAGEMTLLRAFWDAAVAQDASAADRDEGRVMPFCTPDELRGLWSAAGLADVAVARGRGQRRLRRLRGPVGRAGARGRACERLRGLAAAEVRRAALKEGSGAGSGSAPDRSGWRPARGSRRAAWPESYSVGMSTQSAMYASGVNTIAIVSAARRATRRLTA